MRAHPAPDDRRAELVALRHHRARRGGGGAAVASSGSSGLDLRPRRRTRTPASCKITEVLPHSPAELAKIKPGEELRAVDGVAMGAHVNLDEQLQHKIDKRVVLDISGREVTVRPVASLAEQIYRKWVEDNRAYVAKISNGRLGYVHMRDMSEQALTQLYLDLDAENRARDGVVIDIRNNNGGFVNAYALDVLARRPYLTMTDRGGPAGSARTVLGQRSLELPTILVVNQHSLSDAEDFTEGYRTLKLGKVVGEPTAGWIIYTGSMNLVDGIRDAHARDPDYRRRRQEHGEQSAPGGYRGDAPDRRIVHRQGLAVRRRGGGVTGRN